MDINIWKVSQSPKFFNDQENEDLFKRNCVCVHPDTSAKGTSSTTQGEDFSNVKKGDFFYLCYGNTCIRLFGMFTGESQESKLAGKSDWLEQKYKLYFESRSSNKYHGSSAWWTPSDNSTFTKCKNNEDFQEWILKPFFSKTLKDIEMMTNNEEYLCLLKNNSNLILTGAPGTGKTYLAKQIAQQMIFGEVKEIITHEEEKLFNDQCGFVQFHPSYDYTDFVEGLRPKQDENGNICFERKDGVFKEFCKKAIDSQKTDSVDNFNEVWGKLVDSLNENDFIDIPFISNKSKTFRVELNEYGTGLANRTYQNNDYQKGEWIKGQSKFFSKEQLYNVYRGLSGIPSGGHDNYRKAVIKYMKEKLGLKGYQIGTITDNKAPFVFIIDEINRGEINKIFGELFFSIDPGYRGEKDKVQTQYQNLIEDGDVFKDGFCVPENVYIIGTMNDIDRSVESMDFAFRRRFAFKEVKADENVGMLDGLEWKDEAIERMKNLNKAISTIESLSSAYHIGASYFLKLKNYNGDFAQLWEYHLEGLLREYLRGMQNLEENILKLKQAYDGVNPNSGQQQ